MASTKQIASLAAVAGLAIGIGAPAAKSALTGPTVTYLADHDSTDIYRRGDSLCVDRTGPLLDGTPGKLTFCSTQTITTRGDTINIEAVPVCQAGLSEYTTAPRVRGYNVFTLSEAQVSDTLGNCKGVAVARVINGTTRFIAQYPPCPADTTRTWRQYTSTYASLSAATDRVANTTPACK